jgi:hypothetical protein
MSESDFQYRISFIAPIADWEAIVEWANTNIGDNTFDVEMPQYLSPGGLPEATHVWSNAPYTVPAATLFIAYLRGKDRVGYALPEGWEEMDKAARLAAIDDDEDAALAANGILSVMTSNQESFDPFTMLPRIETGGADLEQYWP